MVVHPAPGNANGTLVNAVLHHCGLPALELLPGREMPSALSAWPGRSCDMHTRPWSASQSAGVHTTH